jgi:hypothetical protein
MSNSTQDTDEPQGETSELFQKVKKVIALIEQGTSENKACHQVGINRPTFRNAALRYKVDSEYARALCALAQNQVELLESAIDDMREGKIDAQMARVEIDARKWFASKFLPKRYGEKITQEISGPDGLPIAQTSVSMTAEQESQLQNLIQLAQTTAKKP